MDIIKEIESKINRKVVLVLTGNYSEFISFIKERLREFNTYGMWEGYEFVYYSSLDNIRGMIYNNYFCYGTYYNRDDIDYNYIKSHIRDI